MEKVTDKLIAKYKGNKKGTLYIYLIKANEIAFRNHYSRLNTETIRIESRLESIYGKEGSFWRNDFRGFDEIMEAGKLAQSDIKKELYTPSVMNFLEAALESYLPKGEIKEEPVMKTRVIEDEVQIHLEPGVTGAKYVADKNKTIKELEEEKENIASLEEDLSLLDDHIDEAEDEEEGYEDFEDEDVQEDEFNEL